MASQRGEALALLKLAASVIEPAPAAQSTLADGSARSAEIRGRGQPDARAVPDGGSLCRNEAAGTRL
jgi:hypothetical protein